MFCESLSPALRSNFDFSADSSSAEKKEALKEPTGKGRGVSCIFLGKREREGIKNREKAQRAPGSGLGEVPPWRENRVLV